MSAKVVGSLRIFRISWHMSWFIQYAYNTSASQFFTKICKNYNDRFKSIILAWILSFLVWDVLKRVSSCYSRVRWVRNGFWEAGRICGDIAFFFRFFFVMKKRLKGLITLWIVLVILICSILKCFSDSTLNSISVYL